VPDEALKAYPKLRAADGRKIVAGLRSQYLHPAADRPDLPTIEAEVELVEALGSESIVYFKIDAFAIREGQHEEVAEAPVSAEGIVAARPNLVAEFPAHTVLRLTDQIPVAVDVARMHFFDGETGEPLR
jgi:multiple sugar transport system ATP-binding protein